MNLVYNIKNGGSMKKRSQIEEKYKWNMGEIYATDKAWNEDFEKAKTYLPRIEAYKGKLSKAKNLKSFFALEEEFSMLIEKLSLYLGRKHDEDTTVSKYKEMQDKFSTFLVKFNEATVFVDIEESKISDKDLDKLLKDPTMQDYSMDIMGIKRNKHLLLSDKEEKLLAGVGSFAGGFSDVFDSLDSSDIKFPDATDSKGKKYEVSHSSYSTLIESKDRTLRRNAFGSLYSTFKQFSNTIATNYIQNVYVDWFYNKARKFDSCLSASLYANNIPNSVYEKLLSNVDKLLPILHDYYKLVKKTTGLKDFTYYDVYISPVESLDSKISYDKMVELGLNAVSVLGEEYVSTVKRGVDERWIDVFPNENKATGAYQTDAYAIHPYVLLNFDGRKSYTSTFVHEMGHAMHSYYANSAQPYAKAGYSIFVAEVASTVNEILLNHYLLKHAKTKHEKAYYASEFLQSIKSTFFRQTMFSQFEDYAHKLVERGEVIGKDILLNYYGELNKKYFGSAVKYDEYIAYECLRIPHFYNSYYVYKYATGITTAVNLVRMIETEPGGVEKYLDMLRAGGSDWPVEVLKKAGVDLTSDKPYEVLREEMEKYVKILKENL